MGWFTRKLSDPEEAFARLAQKDKKISARAADDFVNNLNFDFIEFLVAKFEQTDSQETRLKILEIFAKGRSKLGEEELRLVLKLITYPDVLFRETFKEILSCLTQETIKPVTELLSSTTDKEIHRTVQFGIEKSGLLDDLLAKWKNYTTKEQILYLEEIVALQNPKTYPIFLDILKDETSSEAKDEKRIIQAEFAKHIAKIKSPDFLDLCIKELPSISAAMRYPVFKCLQMHGENFFKQIFKGLNKKTDNFRLNMVKLLKELSDPLSYPYLFDYLKDKSRDIAPVVADTISNIIKKYCETLEVMLEQERTKEETQKQIAYYVEPLEKNLTPDNYANSQVLTEGLLRLGRYEQEIILHNFKKIYDYNEAYFKIFIKGLEPSFRQDLLLNACCYKNDVETGMTALKILADPSENYIVETLNTLILTRFMDILPEVQSQIIEMTMDPRLERFMHDVTDHHDPAVRSRVLWILGESAAQNSLKLIEKKMTDSNLGVREKILEILDFEHFKNAAGTEVMLKMLKDTDSSIVLKTIEKLKERDHPKIIAALTKLLASNNSAAIKKAAHSAVAGITRRKYLMGFDRMAPDTKLAVGVSLLKMDSSFMSDITKDLSADSPQKRVLSAKILEVLCDYIPPDLKANLIVAMKDPDPHVRAVVIMGLGKIGGPSVSGMLAAYLKDPDDRVRANAVEAMGIVGDLSLAEKITPCLYDDNNRVRANSIITLWRLGYYDIFEAVIDMLRHSDKWMRASAAFALGELKDPRFFGVLIQNIRDTDADVRRNIVRALSKIANPVVLAPYVRPLRFDPDEGVRKAVAAVLSPKQAQQRQ